MQQPVILQISDVFKAYKQTKAVNGINLQIAQNEYIALLGPNGAGKTTLVEMVEGILKPDTGSIALFGKHWKGNENFIHHKIGLSLQETRFIDKLTVVETLNLFGSFYNLPVNRSTEILHLVNLYEKKKAYVNNLSGGQRQRLSLGLALLNNPELLILDEPTTGLDPAARQEIWHILMNLKKQGNTSLLLTTHYMEEAEYLCDRIVIINAGVIIAQGTLNELVAMSGAAEIIEFTLDLLKYPNQIDLPAGYKYEFDAKNNKYIIHTDKIVKTLPVLLNYFESCNLNPGSVITRRITLNDIFLSLTGQNLND